MRKVALAIAFLGAALSLAAFAENETQLQATVTMILGDKTPERVSGAQEIMSGHVALDYGYRSVVIALPGETTITKIVLKADPETNRGRASNKNLSADNLEVYAADDNKSFKKLRFRLEATDSLTVVLDQITLDGLHPARARYWKVHYNRKTLNYLFVNDLKKMVLVYGSAPVAAVAETNPLRHYELPDPLFEPLLSDHPGPGFVMYWQAILGHGRTTPYHPPRSRAFAKKFGFRYVFEEELAEAARYNMSPWVLPQPYFRKHGIRSWRANVGDWGAAYAPAIDGMPEVFGKACWVMDPRWHEWYVRTSLGKATGEHWALMAGDELWEVSAIKIPPQDKRYDKVLEADKEIREKYGFGKFGMPDNDADSNPFKRIAHKRWVSDKLTEMFRKTHEAVKAVNPNMVLISPDYASAVPAADHEAWAPYFDIIMSQTGQINKPYAAKFRVGCETKILVDLTETPVWMLVQQALPVNYDGFRMTPEDIVERYSQVFRNGGRGMVIIALEWYEPELLHPKHAEPDKWRAMLHVVEQFNKMNRVKVPEEADCAILYPSDTLLTHRWGQINEGGRMELYSTYAILGPFLRSWFKFVSDRQIDRGTRNLNDYKVLYVPYAEYVRGSVLNKIETYVKNGGTLVVTDTDAFTWNINGRKLSEQWARISGVRRAAKRTGGANLATVRQSAVPFAKQLTIAMPSPGWGLRALSGKVINLCVFDDGSPAVTLHRYGSGRVIVFASDPFGPRGKTPLVHPDSPLNGLFEGIQKAVGCRMGHDIWRFRFPPVPPEPEEKFLCLTGNNVVDRVPTLVHNLETGGTYTYSRSPEAIPDCKEAGKPIAFTAGHLTNRATAYKTRMTKESPDKPSDQLPKWIVSWKDRAPVSVTFDLTRPYDLNRLRSHYSAAMPALKTYGSADARTWSLLATAPKDDADDDVKDLTLALQGRHRYVRLDFEKRGHGDRFELCEVELWGMPPQ